MYSSSREGFHEMDTRGQCDRMDSRIPALRIIPGLLVFCGEFFRQSVFHSFPRLEVHLGQNFMDFFPFKIFT